MRTGTRGLSLGPTLHRHKPGNWSTFYHLIFSEGEVEAGVQGHPWPLRVGDQPGLHETLSEGKQGTGGRTQWLVHWLLFPEDPGSIPDTHTSAHNQLGLQFQRTKRPLLASRGIACTGYKIYMQANTCTHNLNTHMYTHTGFTYPQSPLAYH